MNEREEFEKKLAVALALALYLERKIKQHFGVE